MYIIFLGAPGAGKGTQAAVVADKLKLSHVATGDLFRQALAQGTELGLKAKVYMEKGALVPDELTIRMLLEHLAALKDKAGAILDGFPRNLNQAKALDAALAEHNETIAKVVYIKVSEAELIKRLSGRWVCRQCQTPYHVVDSPPRVWGRCDKCGGKLYQRADDTSATVRHRLSVYFSETAPLIEYYAGRDKLIEVDGEGDIDEVSQRIVAALREGKLVTR